MSETTRPARKPTLRRNTIRILALGAVAATIVGVGLIVGLRREIAREAVSAWLEHQGVQAQVRFDALSPSHLSGALVIGPPTAPVLVARQVDADVSIRWSITRGFEMRLSRVRLIRPRLHAWLGPKGLSFGQLDPLLRKLEQQGPEASHQPLAPEIQIRQGDLILTTAAGTAITAVDARIAQGRLVSLTAELSMPARLRLEGWSMALDALRLQVRSLPGTHIALDIHSQAETVRAQGVAFVRPTLAIHGVAKQDRSTGALRLVGPARVIVRAEVVRLGAAEVRNLSLGGDLASGWAEESGGRWTWGLNGEVDAQAARARARGVDLSGLSLAFTRLSAGGTGAQAAVASQVQAAAGAAAGQGWRARAVAANADLALDGPQGSGRLGGDFRAVDVADTVSAGLVRKAFGGPLGAALDRALEGFTLTGRRVDVSWNRDGVRLNAADPIIAQAPEVSVSVASRRGAPLLEAGPDGEHGAFTVSAQALGATAHFDLSSLRLAADGFGAKVTANASGLAIGPVRGGRISLDGVLAGMSRSLSFTARRCLDLDAEQVVFERDVVTGFAGRICPTAAPLLEASADGWRASGRLQAFRLVAPSLQLRAEAAAGPIAIADLHNDLTADVKLDNAEVIDLANRFRPATAIGSLALRSGTWRGDLELSVRKDQVARLRLADDLASGQGNLSIVSGPLAFRRGGLQPDDLTPLAAGLVGPPVEGVFAFRGGFVWSRAGVRSAGRATVRNLSFGSPLGAAKGGALTLNFTSLAPLISQPAQPFHIDRIDSFVPLTGVQARVQLLADRVRVEGADAAAAGGALRLERTEIPFAERAAWSGALDLHEIRTDDLIKASPFAGKLQLTARIDGRLPFIVAPQGISFIKGHFAATGPGRLSIPRALLAGGQVAAAGAPPQATPNAMQSMAYQALEDLAFSKLDAEVNSLPGGRLGVLFHVKGHHDPAHPRSLNLPLGAALRGQIADKPLPLPAGTEVDLTLDTSLNFDELEHDFNALRPPARR